MALALNNLKRVDMPLNKETNQTKRIQQYLYKSYEQEFHMVKARQITKLEKMKTINMKIQPNYSPV